MTELDPTEQKRQAKIPNYRSDSDDVLPERNIGGGGFPIVATDDELIGPFNEGMSLITRGQELLNSMIFPFDIQTSRLGNITMKRYRTFYFVPEEVRIQVTQGRIDEDGRIYVDFERQESTFPKRTWTMRTRDIARLIEDDQLRTEEDVHDQVMEALNQN